MAGMTKCTVRENFIRKKKDRINEEKFDSPLGLPGEIQDPCSLKKVDAESSNVMPDHDPVSVQAPGLARHPRLRSRSRATHWGNSKVLKNVIGIFQKFFRTVVGMIPDRSSTSSE